MDDINSFIKCHGLIKDEIIKNNKLIKVDKRFYAFNQKHYWTLLLWNDEQTIWFQYGNTSHIELWHTGKKIYSKKCETVENATLFSACLQLYSIQESFAESKYETFSKLD